MKLENHVFDDYFRSADQTSTFNQEQSTSPFDCVFIAKHVRFALVDQWAINNQPVVRVAIRTQDTNVTEKMVDT